MLKSKQRSEQHLIDAEGERLLRSRLPRHWVLREYRPDYGLDFALEIFRKPTGPAKKHATYETLGEHIFIQLKSIASATMSPLKIYGRDNVEKKRELLDNDDLVGALDLDTIRFSIETPELITVQRMGVGVPVLLVVADTSTARCHFVCLNDYIDKIFVPRHDDYTTKDTRTIHVPIANEIRETPVGCPALRWYAKRPKLYSAFQRFVFQEAELRLIWNTDKFLPMARYFASRIAGYDFWDDTEMWGIIAYYGAAIRNFIRDGNPNLMTRCTETISSVADGDADRANELEDYLDRQEVLVLWRNLALLPRNYEDVCREWFLPTSLGYACSYSVAPQKK